MAQNSVISGILGDLVTSIANRSDPSKSRSIRQSKDAALRGVRPLQHVRTNHFEVQSTLDGLIEKFSVINRDELAYALSKRFAELQRASTSKWTPEVLSLLINLSDQPDLHSTLEALELLKPSFDPPSSVTWEQIMADDPLTGDLWQDESYSSCSEDDLDAEDYTESRHRQSQPKEDGWATHQPNVQTLLTPVSSNIIEELKLSQFWDQTIVREPALQQLSELQVVREILLMLRGLPTSLFAIDLQHYVIYAARDVSLSQVSLSGISDLLTSFAYIGSGLLKIRVWTRQKQAMPLLQCFSFAVSARLKNLEEMITSIEDELVASSKPITISLLQLNQEMSTLYRPFAQLGQITASTPFQDGDFTCLELLYDSTCSLQAAGDDGSYAFISKIFLQCLQVYLRPVMVWMEEGVVVEKDVSTFISVADKASTLASLWHDRFTLRTRLDGQLHAPKFLHPAARKILNSGKCAVFLRHLNSSVPKLTETSSTFSLLENVHESQETTSLVPFSELFDAAFKDWISSRHGPAASILKHQLLDGWSLLQYVDALEYVYLSKDGVRFQALADEIFRRMDRQRASWNDKFILSELLRSVYGDIKAVKVETLSIRTIVTKQAPRSSGALRVIIIDMNMPWPVQNIIPHSSLTTYQHIFCLLLQVYRAEYVLRLDSVNLRDSGLAVKRISYAVRQRLLWFTNIIHSYITETVIRGSLKRFRASLVAAEDIDAMFELHEELIAELASCCLLAKNLAPIQDSILSILDLATLYYDAQTSHIHGKASKAKSGKAFIRQRGYGSGRRREQGFEDLDDTDLSSGGSDGEPIAETVIPAESYEKSLQNIYEQFSRLLKFTVAGLRGVSRAGGQPAWEMLAENLEWSDRKHPSTDS